MVLFDWKQEWKYCIWYIIPSGGLLWIVLKVYIYGQSVIWYKCSKIFWVVLYENKYINLIKFSHVQRWSQMLAPWIKPLNFVAEECDAFPIMLIFYFDICLNVKERWIRNRFELRARSWHFLALIVTLTIDLLWHSFESAIV